MFRKHFLASINQLLFSDDFQVGRLVASEAELLLCFELHRQTLAVPSASEIYEISAHRGEAIPKILDEPPSHMPDVGFAVESRGSLNVTVLLLSSQFFLDELFHIDRFPVLTHICFQFLRAIICRQRPLRLGNLRRSNIFRSHFSRKSLTDCPRSKGIGLRCFKTIYLHESKYGTSFKKCGKHKTVRNKETMFGGTNNGKTSSREKDSKKAEFGDHRTL